MVTSAELPGWLRRIYPFEPKSLLCGTARLSYVDEGPRGDEAVLLVHGNPTWSFYYRKLIGQLTAAGLRCVAPDHVGMGLSDKPQDYPYRLATHIENLERLAAALQDGVVAATRSKDRGVRSASLYTAKATMPAALVEMGFVTEKSDALSLQDPAVQERVAAAVLDAISDFLADK